MKISIIMTTANMAGGTRVIARHAQELIARGHDVHVYCTPPKTLPLRRKVSRLLEGKGWPAKPEVEASFFDHTAVPRTIAQRFQPFTDRDLPDADIVMATWWETAEWVWQLSPSKGAKVFFIQHYETWGGDERRVDGVWRLPMQKIVVSQWLADIAAEKFGDAHATLVANGVDLEQFHAPPRGRNAVPRVGFMYSKASYKRTELAIEAIEQVRQHIPELRVTSFSSKPPSSEPPLPGGCDFHLSPPQQEIPQLYASCDAWLVCSESEGFGLPVLEAMACRTPVIATPAGAAPELLAGGGGRLVEPDQVAQALLNICRLPEADWQKMSQCAVQTASKYSWRDAADAMQQALERAKMGDTPLQSCGAASLRL